MAQVRLIARVVAKPGKAEELKARLRQMIAPTHREEGCLFYELFEASEGGRFLFNELWASQEALDKHANSAHFKEFIGSAQPLLAEPLELNFLTEVK
jgi:quinol monooxygenase YgiN